MAHLSTNELERGVVACSAGNHAQGVAMSARMLQCRAVIVMPLATPAIKVNAVRTHGGSTVEVRLFGNNYDEAAAEAYRLVKEEDMTLIHPFDDPLVIAGQGTIGTYMLSESCVCRAVAVCFLRAYNRLIHQCLAGLKSFCSRARWPASPLDQPLLLSHTLFYNPLQVWKFSRNV